MTVTPQPTRDPSTVAVLHSHNGQCYAVIGSVAEARVRVLDARAFPTLADQGLAQWFEERRVGRILCVLPASMVICRTVTLPAAGADQMDQALRLQAEAHLLGIAPPHRQAMAVLPAAAGETARAGLVIAWPELRAFDIPHHELPITCTADVASLAAMCNSHRPTKPLIWIDPTNGAMALAIAHAGGMVFRSLNESLYTREEVAASLRRTLAETAMNVGHTGPFIQGLIEEAQLSVGAFQQGSMLSLPSEVRDDLATRLAGVPDDNTWWSRFGIAAGSLLTLAGELAPLASLLPSIPDLKPSPVAKIVERLSNRRVAISAAMVCALVLIFGPLIVHGLRLAILSMRFPNIDTDRRLVESLADQHKMYMELHKRSWSITKVLSDIACNTPLDLEVDLIRINAADRGFSIMGKALGRASENLTARDNVTRMQKNLHDTGLFKDITFTIERGDFSGRYNFDLSARVDRPFHRFDYARRASDRDFAVWTHLDRIMGKTYEEVTRTASSTATGASNTEAIELVSSGSHASTPFTGSNSEIGNTAIASPSSNGRSGTTSPRPTTSTSRTTTTRPTTGVSSGDEPGSFTRTDERGMTVAPVVVPAAITQAQVDAMTQEEVKSALSNVSKARQLASLSEEDKERLKNEFNMLLKRLRSF